MSMENLSDEERIAVTRTAMAIVDSWKLTGEQILFVLGLPEGTRTRHLAKFRDNTCAICGCRSPIAASAARPRSR